MSPPDTMCDGAAIELLEHDNHTAIILVTQRRSQRRTSSGITIGDSGQSPSDLRRGRAKPCFSHMS